MATNNWDGLVLELVGAGRRVCRPFTSLPLQIETAVPSSILLAAEATFEQFIRLGAASTVAVPASKGKVCGRGGWARPPDRRPNVRTRRPACARALWTCASEQLPRPIGW